MNNPVAMLEVLRQREADRTVEKRERQEAVAKQNRERFPDLAFFVDECRTVFGDVKVMDLKVENSEAEK